MKQVFNKTKIDTSKYVNIETGETLQSENPNITSLNSFKSDLVMIDYKEYVVIDSQALNYIVQNFSSTEIGRITKMADMVDGCFNILHNKESIPHTDESLMEEVEYTRNKYAEFMKKLYKKGIVYYVTGYKHNKPVKYILLNPYLAKKSKTLHKDCLNYFNPLSVKTNSKGME
jgi:hypothetical protein